MKEVTLKGGTKQMKPTATIEYNFGKSFIDYGDQMGSYATPLRRLGKLLFDLILTTCVVNALHLFKAITV